MTPPPRLSHADLVPHWLICAALLALLVTYNAVCHVWGNEIQIHLDEPQRVLVRTILYAAAIVLFPLTNLLRHIMLRLNHTMPGPQSAKHRYLLTVVVTLAMVETVGVFGLVMFVLGDDFNTLYIFSGLAALGIFLHKPDLDEYLAISQALGNEHNEAG